MRAHFRLPKAVVDVLQGPKSAEEIEKEQEAKLFANKPKYGNNGAKKRLMPKHSKWL